MTGQELTDAGIELFGEKGWMSTMADKLGMDRTAVWRQINNNAVSGPVAAAVTCWLEVKRSKDGIDKR